MNYEKKRLEELEKLFKEKSQYRFEKGIYGQRIGIGKLLEKLNLNINEKFYQTLSLSSHGIYHNKNLLGYTTFAPNLDKNLYKGLLYIHISLIRQVIYVLVNYFYKSHIDLIEFFDTILLNLGIDNVKK